MKHSRSATVKPSIVAGSCYEVSRMKEVCLFEVDIPAVEAGTVDPELMLRVYANGALVIDEKIPVDTVTVGVTAVKGSELIILTGQNDKANGLNPTWITHPAKIHGEEILKGDYSRVEHVGESEADESELREGLVTFGVRTKSDVVETEPSMASNEILTEETQAPASIDQPGTTPDFSQEESVTTTQEASGSLEEPTTSEGPLV